MVRKKGKKRQQNACVENPPADGDENEDKSNIRTVKTQLKNILRPAYRDILIAAISEKSIVATEICCFASLLFLYRIKNAFDNNHYEFFTQKGDDIIRRCFYDVCAKKGNNAKVDAEFSAFAEAHQIKWPDNAFFGNGMNDLIDTYTTNVKNNLAIHQDKRLRQFLLMKVYQNNNSNPIVVRYEEKDIDRVISLAIYGRDSIKTIDLDTVAERARRDLLLDNVIGDSWFDIPHKNIGQYTKKQWFKSIQFWIALQQQIDDFNIAADQREDRQIKRAQVRERRKCRRRNHRNCTCKAPENQSKTTEKGPPQIKNLSVIPFCNYKRTHFTLDNYTMYSLLCETNIIPFVAKEKGQKGRPKREISRKEFFEDNIWYWSHIFDMQKINRLVHGKSKFRCRILSNGQAVSVQFSVDKKDCIQFDKETIAREYKQKKFELEGATDPGERTWDATVIRDIETGKEVNCVHSLSI